MKLIVACLAVFAIIGTISATPVLGGLLKPVHSVVDEVLEQLQSAVDSAFQVVQDQLGVLFTDLANGPLDGAAAATGDILLNIVELTKSSVNEAIERLQLAIEPVFQVVEGTPSSTGLLELVSSTVDEVIEQLQSALKSYIHIVQNTTTGLLTGLGGGFLDGVPAGIAGATNDVLELVSSTVDEAIDILQSAIQLVI